MAAIAASIASFAAKPQNETVESVRARDTVDIRTVTHWTHVLGQSRTRHSSLAIVFARASDRFASNAGDRPRVSPPRSSAGRLQPRAPRVGPRAPQARPRAPQARLHAPPARLHAPPVRPARHATPERPVPTRRSGTP